MKERERLRKYLDDLQIFGIKLGLDNIRVLCASFDNPQRAFLSVHVGGTNGKGSVCAMLAEVLGRAGYRVGLYTSPHFVRVEERIRVNGRLIPPPDFDRLLAEVKARVEELLASGRLESPPTFFEALTALAFLYFRKRGVDLAVLEVGMGGRFDATNVVRPLVSVITTVSRDHTEHLGRTIAQIAFEKAGIIKPRVPVVSGVRNAPAARVIEDAAERKKARLFRVFGEDNPFEPRRSGGRWRFDYRFGGEEFQYTPRLASVHQGENAAMAIAAARVLSRVWKPLGRATIVEGIEQARWEGRLEPAGRRPLFLLDGAHNEAGMRALRAYIETEVSPPPVVVFAMMRDKAIGRSARVLFPAAGKVVLTSLPFERAASPAQILARARLFENKILIEPNLWKALALARQTAGPEGTVIAAGSLYLIGELKKLLIRIRR
jgi:dihydrofolate synthase/folylpolyglutamate synthase